MRKYYTSSVQLFRQIKSDYMLTLACIVPFFVGCIVKFAVPILEDVLTKQFQLEFLLTPYYPLFDLFLSMIAPIMFCFAFAMILLEEIDDKVARYFMITPLGKGGYLFSRIGIPAILSLLFTPPILMFFHIGSMNISTLLEISLLGTLLGMIVALMIVSLSSNKLEGMAVTKMSSLLTLGIFPPFFINGNSEYLFVVLPSYWLAKCVQSGHVLVFMSGLFSSCLWMYLLIQKFNKKVSS